MEAENIVKKGYNKIAERYDRQRGRFNNQKELAQFVKCFKKGAKILDLGCGAGVPVDRFLIKRGLEVTGIDFSERMLKLARKNVPKAKYLKRDMCHLQFPKDTFEGAAALYSIIHVPRQKHKGLFSQLHKVIKPEGIILVCVGSEEWEAVDDYEGTKMYWSQWSKEKELAIIKAAGFEIISDRVLNRGGERHYWIMARCQKN